MNERILHVLQHALGRDQYGISRSGDGQGRSHFVASPGHADFEICRKAVSLGLMTENPASNLSGGSAVFFVTTEGMRYVDVNSQKPPDIGMNYYREMCRQFTALFGGKGETPEDKAQDALRKAQTIMLGIDGLSRSLRTAEYADSHERHAMGNASKHEAELREHDRWLALQPDCQRCVTRYEAPGCGRRHSYEGSRGPGGALIISKCSGFKEER